MPQSRARRCSFSAAMASFSMRPRSHCWSLSAIVNPFEVDLAVALFHQKRDQRSAAARAAEAFAAVRGIRGAVRRAYQIALVQIEHVPFAPIELHGQV